MKTIVICNQHLPRKPLLTMEKLKSLASSLPPEQAPTEENIDGLMQELSQEFKTAANAVAQLYRVANEKNSLVRHQGYLECLDELLSQLGRGKLSSVDDVKRWCLRERSERLGTCGKTSESHKQGKRESRVPPNNDTSRHPTYISPVFRRSMPPLSVEQSHKVVQNVKERRKLGLTSLDRHPENINRQDTCTPYPLGDTETNTDIFHVGESDGNLPRRSRYGRRDDTNHCYLGSDRQPGPKRLKRDT